MEDSEARRREAIRRSWVTRRSTFVPPLKGKRMNAAKVRAAALARGGRNRLGKAHTIEARAKISATLRVTAARGEHAPGYIDGRGAERMGERVTLEYKRWRVDVYRRDGYTCQRCGDARGRNLTAHHIKPFALFPDLRLVVANGVTLCRKCHKEVHREMEIANG